MKRGVFYGGPLFGVFIPLYIYFYFFKDLLSSRGTFHFCDPKHLNCNECVYKAAERLRDHISIIFQFFLHLLFLGYCIGKMVVFPQNQISNKDIVYFFFYLQK